ncbi:MAG: TIGR03435 family protein [Bryobacteraceae bacterium]
MKQIMLCYSFLALSQGTGVAQCQENGSAFEVASVKPAALAPGAAGKDCTGGPGTSDPENFRCSGMPLAAVLVRAYDISFTNLRAPDWVSWMANRYDIAAKVPSGTSKEQFQAMLQNLLCERFHLLVHHEMKMLPSYTLSIGKVGSKLRAHSASESSSSLPASGRPGTFTWVDTHHLRVTANDLDIKSFARMLTSVMQEPVADETGLAGGYDFVLDFAPPEILTGGGSGNDIEALPDIFAVLAGQLGLNLAKKNVPRELIVVDQSNKVPTEN